MNKEVKKLFVENLKKKHEEMRVVKDDEVIEYRLSPHEQFPIQKILVITLSQMYPDVVFTNLVGARVDVGTKKQKKIVGARGKSWDSILKYAELDRIDFYIPDYKFIAHKDTGEIKVISVWGKNYKHPTPGSIISVRFQYKKSITYLEMAELIDKYL